MELDTYINKGQIKKNPKLLTSINLLSELWGIRSGDKKCTNYLNKIKNDTYLKSNNDLIQIATLMIAKEKNSITWRFPEKNSLDQILINLNN